MSPHFFIVGPGRSGTTLLRAILDARPDTRIPGETHFYTTYRIENIARYHFLTAANYATAAQRYSNWRHVRYENLDWDRFREIAASLPPRRGSILQAYLATCAEHVGATYMGEKTPGHIRALRRIWRDFPAARFVNVMRDPRDVAASYLDHTLYARVFGDDVTRAVMKWIEAARIHRQVNSDPRYLMIRFEDLVAQPDQYLDAIQSFLGLPPEPGILRLYESAKLTLPNNPNHVNINRPISASRIAAWKTRLSKEDVAYVESFARKEMLALGYAPSGGPLISAAELNARRLRYWQTFGRYGGRRFIRAVRGRHETG